jgi:hypothetical protein
MSNGLFPRNARVLVFCAVVTVITLKAPHGEQIDKSNGLQSLQCYLEYHTLYVMCIIKSEVSM